MRDASTGLLVTDVDGNDQMYGTSNPIPIQICSTDQSMYQAAYTAFHGFVDIEQQGYHY